MKTVAMCFTLLQAPRSRIHTLVATLCSSLCSISRSNGSNITSKLSSPPDIYGLQGRANKRWTKRPLTNKAGGNKNSLSRKPSSISQHISDETITAPAQLNVNRLEVGEYQSIQHVEVQQISEKRNLAKYTTVFVFDIETTGLSREERIIEIALQDLLGGENSTFQTLINPERLVPNPHVHGISTHMVNRPDVPRMKELIPILLQYVRSRQRPGGQVLWIAHNARTFDVPFLINEFNRCSFEVPDDWLFMDTMALGRELMKSGRSNLPSKISLQGLREHYGIPLVGSAHRAMSDVRSLSLILQRLTFDLKLPVSSLVERSFTASDLNGSPKRKKSSR